MTAPTVVIKVTADVLKVPLRDIRSRSRRRHTAFTRQVGMWLLLHRYDLSLGDVAVAVNRDRTTVMQGAQRVKDLIDAKDPRTLKAIAAIEARLDELESEA